MCRSPIVKHEFFTLYKYASRKKEAYLLENFYTFEETSQELSWKKKINLYTKFKWI